MTKVLALKGISSHESSTSTVLRTSETLIETKYQVKSATWYPLFGIITVLERN